jgi:hypothetical protein
MSGNDYKESLSKVKQFLDVGTAVIGIGAAVIGLLLTIEKGKNEDNECSNGTSTEENLKTAEKIVRKSA